MISEKTNKEDLGGPPHSVAVRAILRDDKWTRAKTSSLVISVIFL